MYTKIVGSAVLGAAVAYALVLLPVGAQTVPTLSCSPGTASVHVGEAALFTATGGNGNYSWSGQNLVVSNANGVQFTATYPSPGVYTITVSSAGQTANCTAQVTVVASGSVSCLPVTQNVAIGQPALFTATGGNGSYVWSGDGLTLNNPTGSGFQATYSAAGAYNVRVTSNGQTASCVVNVLAAGSSDPGLPNTGFGGGAE